MGFNDMFQVLNISGSGLSAERSRMNLIAHNIANVNTLKTPDGGPYKRQEAIFSEVLTEAEHSFGSGGASTGFGGVKMTAIVDSPEPTRRVYDPTNSLADKDGYVTLPNVDVVREMIDMISASRAYEANLAVGKTAKGMILATIDLIR